MIVINYIFVLQLLGALYALDAAELKASAVMNFQLCHNESTRDITAPTGYVIYTERIIIGVTENDLCHAYDPVSHCTIPAEELQQTECLMKANCLYRVPKAAISKCGPSKFATYIYVEYRFIPVQSQNPQVIGPLSNDVDLSARPYGVIVTQGYPQWTENVDYRLGFFSRNSSQALRLYLTEMDIEDADYADSECKNSYFEFNDGVNKFAKICGMVASQNITYTSLAYTVCTSNPYTDDQLMLSYKTGARDSFSDYYTGVKAYYEVIEKPDSMNCVELSPTYAYLTTEEPTAAEPIFIDTTAEPTTEEPTATELIFIDTTAEPITEEPTTEEPTATELIFIDTTAEPTTEEPIFINTTEYIPKENTTWSTSATTKPEITKPTKKPLPITLTEQVLLNWGYDHNTTHINISASNIIKIDESTFSNFNQLLYLDLSHNHLTERSYKLSIFYGLHNLIELRLNNNKIRRLRSHLKLPLIFEHLVNLQYLDLSNNIFHQIDSFYFRGLRSLRKLGLEGNVIQRMSKNAFENLNLLESVCLKANPVSFNKPSFVTAAICRGRLGCQVLIKHSCCDYVECYIP